MGGLSLQRNRVSNDVVGLRGIKQNGVEHNVFGIRSNTVILYSVTYYWDFKALLIQQHENTLGTRVS